MKLNPNPKRGFTLVELLVVIAIIAALAALSAPMIMGQVKRADRTEAINNAKQIGIALFSFQEEYGSHPDDITRDKVVENNDGSGIEADEASSNGYFRQLFIAGITESETMFYAKTGFTVKPNGLLEDDTLIEGECGFAYITNEGKGLTTAGNPSRVSACTPVDKDGEFIPEAFDKKAVCLRMDNSASALTINAEGEVVLGGGKTLLDAGEGTVWGESSTPQIENPL
jgi:prepilin-type N-terminal cleavage/methylation domain-containing protein